MYINISSHSLRYGIYLGFKLSRLEWIWGSKFEFAQKEFEPSKLEVLSMLPLDDMQLEESDYKAFAQSILNYYLRNDMAIYSSILIGITIQRCALIGKSNNAENNKEMKELAKSALVSIPQSIISNRDHLFEMINKHSDKDLFEIIDVIEKNIDKKNLNNNEMLMKDSNSKPTLFLSYSEKDSPIADIIENQLNCETNNGVKISRYTRMPYKESFKSFMNSIQEHDFVMCLVSDNYLKSQACMYEVGEIIKDHSFENKLLFVVISESDEKYYGKSKENFAAAQIYGKEENRLKYVQYWKAEYNKLQENIKGIGDTEAVVHATQKLKEIGKIYRNDISEFLTYLSQNNGKTFEELYDNEFAEIIEWIIQH